MRIRELLSAAVVACAAAESAFAGTLIFQAHVPGSHSFFNITTHLVPLPPQIIPPDPIQDLSDPTHLLLTQQVQNEALFSFGMEGMNGEEFSITPNQDSLTLFRATGTQGSAFNVFFDPFYSSDTGTNRPFSTVFIPGNPVIPGNPIFPPGSFSLDYTLQVAADPPFSVGISILDLAGNNLIFTSVPEPGSLTLVAGFGLIGLLGWRRRKRTTAV